MASVVANELPAEVAATVVNGANQAFIDAMNAGFTISSLIVLGAVIIAFGLIPKRMRTLQAGSELAHPLEPAPAPAA